MATRTDEDSVQASQLVAEYLTNRYRTLRTIKESPHGTIYLVEDTMATPSQSSSLLIEKCLYTTGLPYKELQSIDCDVFPKVFYTTEFPSANTTIVIEEFIAGEPLSNRLAQKRYLTPKEATRLLLTICNGLTILHQHGILHRDIKPSNIMEPPGASSSGLYRLIDFDAARTVKEGHVEDTRLLGTKGYAPPEQYGSAQTDARSDLYALGVTVRELLGPDYRGPLRPILAKCTEQDPDRRFKNAAKLASAVRHAKLRYYGKRVLILAVIALCALAALLPWHSAPSSEETQPVQDELKTIGQDVKTAVKKEGRTIKNKVEQAKSDLGLEKLPTPSLPAKVTPASPAAPAPQTAPQAAPQAAAKPSAEEPAAEADDPESPLNCVRARLYCDGRLLNGWMDNWDTPIPNGVTDFFVDPDVWQSGNLSPYILTVKITNESDHIFASPTLTVLDIVKKKTATAGAILPGDTAEITMPLSEFATRAGGTTLHVNITGMGPQDVLPPVYTLSFTPK